MRHPDEDAPVLGHPELDAQHAVIHARLAEAVAGMERTRPEAEGAMARLADAILEHFAAEEALIDASAFPEASRHRAAHELFLTDFRELQAALAQQGPTPDLTTWLRVRVAEWLRFHTLVNDRRLVEHLARRGVRRTGGKGAGRGARRS